MTVSTPSLGNGQASSPKAPGELHDLRGLIQRTSDSDRLSPNGLFVEIDKEESYQVVPTNVQYAVTPITVPSLKVTYTLVNVPNLYVRLQLLNELLGVWVGTVMVSTTSPEPLPEPPARPNFVPPKDWVFGSMAAVQVTPFAAATWNVVVS